MSTELPLNLQLPGDQARLGQLEPQTKVQIAFAYYSEAKGAHRYTSKASLQLAERIAVLQARARFALATPFVASHEGPEQGDAKQRIQQLSRQAGQDMLLIQLSQQLLQQCRQEQLELQQESDDLLDQCRQLFASELSQLMQTAQRYGVCSFSWLQSSHDCSRFQWRVDSVEQSKALSQDKLEGDALQPIRQWIDQHRQQLLALVVHLRISRVVRIELRPDGLRLGPIGNETQLSN